MAGFFGIGDFTKEGPGIEKDAPEKKKFVVFFETFFRNFWKFIPLNLLFFAVSLPLVTNGLAYVGYTHVARNTAREKHSFGVSDFFETIKKNWKQTLILGIINVVILFIIAVDIYFFNMMEGTISIFGLGIALASLVVFSFMKYYMWTLAMTFNFSLGQLFKNSFKFAFLNIKKNILVGVCLLAFYAIVAVIALYLPLPLSIIIALLLIVCVLPGFKCLLIQFCTFDAIRKFIIDPYYEKHPDDDIELRLSLGLSVPEKYLPHDDFEENE